MLWVLIKSASAGTSNEYPHVFCGEIRKKYCYFSVEESGLSGDLDSRTYIFFFEEIKIYMDISAIWRLVTNFTPDQKYQYFFSICDGYNVI